MSWAESSLNFPLNQILIVAVVPKLFKSDTFPNDLFVVFMS
jgi:hypothetical protein